VAKHIAEIFGDASLKQIDGDGRNQKEHNKPGWSQRILSPEEIRKIRPDAHTVSYPRPDAGDYTPVIIAVDEPNEIWEGRQGGIVTRTPKAKPAAPGAAPKPLQMPSLLGDLMRADVGR
jgi:hypothetical protein